MDKGGINDIKNALEDLQGSYSAVEAAFKNFEEQDLSKENESLHEAVERLNTQLQKSRDEVAELRTAHDNLLSNFKHELSSKRMAMLGFSERQHSAYLIAGLENEHIKIDALFAELKETVAEMTDRLYTLDVNEREPLLAEVNGLQLRINEQAALSQERRDAVWRSTVNNHADKMNEIKSSTIEDAALGAVRNFFAWETFLGLKIISAVGVLLLLLGVFTFGRYLYINMGAELQCAAIFILGAALLVTGEVFHQKKWRGGFALALSAGGSGVMFLGAALGYMTLEVLPMWTALGICAVVSLLSFIASLRHNAQLVAVFALIGGYLPLLVMEEAIVFFGAIYFINLSLLALLVATKKNWRITRFLGLGAGLISQIVLMGVSLGNTTGTGVVAVIGILIAISYVTYLVIPVFGAWFTKTQIIAADVVLLSCNIFISFLVCLLWGTVYIQTQLIHLRDYTDTISAIIAAFFAISCITMALVSERRKQSGVPKTETGSLRALFFITSVTFSGLVVFFALDNVWFSAGWLIQAAGLSLYGIFTNRRHFSFAGLIIGVFCLFSFLLFNVVNHNDPLFVWQYLLITLVAVVVATATLRCKSDSAGLEIFRCVAAINIFGYAVYLLYNPLFPALTQMFGQNVFEYTLLISIIFGYVIAFVLPRLPKVSNIGFDVSAVSIGKIVTGGVILFNAVALGLSSGDFLSGIVLYTLQIFVNIAAVRWVYDYLNFIMSAIGKQIVRWYPLLISGAAMLLLIQNLVVQLTLGVTSLLLTLILGLTSLGWVLFGFARRNGITRIGGLIMAFAAVIKLFVLDLQGLETTWRVVSYFSAGVVLLTISFIYQWFSKRLEASVE